MAKRMILLAAVMVVLAATLIGGATMAWFTDSGDAGDVTFTAGTLSVEAGTFMVFGIQSGTGDLYEIDVDSGNKYLLANDPTGSGDWPNGLAFDRKNNRLYYIATSSSTPKLKFYDIAAKQIKDAGTLPGTIAGATFGSGAYWYVPNTPGSDSGGADLYRVTFNADGTIMNIGLAKENFTSRKFGFGDLAMDMKDAIIYGSSTSQVFFEIDTRDGYAYYEYLKTGSPNSGLQVAFAADGNLYGHTTHNDTGVNWWKLVLDTVAKKVVFEPKTWSDGDPDRKSFNDLASNYQNNWNPGDMDHVRYVFENTGSKNQVLRFSPSFSWAEQGLGNGNVIVSLCSESEAAWEKYGDYFYYISPVLEPGDTATLCLNVQLSGSDTNDDYQGETLNLDGTVEALQASNFAPYHQWGVDFYGEP